MNSHKKKILSVNIGSKGFAEEYINACDELGIAQTKIRARHTCITLRDGEVVLYHGGEKVSLEEYLYTFIRLRGKYPLMTSLLCRLLNAKNVPFNDVFNLEHTQSEEKITQMLLFSLAGIPMPKTTLFALDGYKKNREVIISNTEFPCVLKLNGCQGDNVWKIEDEAALAAKIAELRTEGEHEVAMVQEYIPNTYDIRAIFFYGKYIGAMKRTSTNGFYNNVSRGGEVAPIELTDEELELSLCACEVLGKDLSGVDIVRSERGPLFFEINSRPQIYGFERATGIDVPRALVEHINKIFLSS